VKRAIERPRALRFKTGKVRRVIHRTETAMEVIGPLSPGVRVTGLTAGQFSAIDAMEHMVDELGPANVVEHACAAHEIEVPVRERQRGRVRHGEGAAGRCVLARGLDELLPLVHPDDLAHMLGQDVGERARAAADVERALGARERGEELDDVGGEVLVTRGLERQAPLDWVRHRQLSSRFDQARP